MNKKELINSNIRCIWIVAISEVGIPARLINSNIRCIWIEGAGRPRKENKGLIATYDVFELYLKKAVALDKYWLIATYDVFEFWQIINIQ